MNKKIAFIGGGNMACALIKGLVHKGLAANYITVVDPSLEAQQNIKNQFGIDVLAQANETLANSSIVVIAVKPQVIHAAMADFKRYTRHALHLSIVTGTKLVALQEGLSNPRVVRVMPNTPALVGQGMAALYAHLSIAEQDKTTAQQIIASVGQCLWLNDETQMDAVTALSGSGPAYIFYFMEAMIAAGVQMGLSPEQSKQLSLATFYGASALASLSSESPEQLRTRVTAKGGTTFAATSELDNKKVKESFIDAIKAAQKRSQELSTTT